MATCGICLEDQFVSFAKFGDSTADGKTITLTQIDKWLKQGNVFDKNLTTTDTAISFNKFKSKNITYKEFVKFLEDIAGQKKIDVDDIYEKLETCGSPGMNNPTLPVKTGAVERLTDTSKYTGSHKERFDESGKGRGIEGREYVVEDTGYVTGYKGHGTYDSKHKLLSDSKHKLLSDSKHKLMYDSKHKLVYDSKHKLVYDSKHKLA